MSSWVTVRREDSGRDAEASPRPPRLSLTQLRWITVGVPIVALALALHLVAFALPDVFRTPAGYVAALAVVALAVAGFSHVVFRVIERLEARIVRQNARLTAAAAVADAVSEPDELSGILSAALDGMCPPLGADAGSVRWLDPRTDAEQTVSHGGRARELAELLGRTGRDGAGSDEALDGASLMIVVDDVSVAPELEAVAVTDGLRSLLSIPLSVAGSSMGTLMLGSELPRRFGPEDRRVIQQIAHQLGVAAQRSNLIGEAIERNDELRLVNDLSSQLVEARGLPEVLDVVLRVLMRASGGGRAGFWLTSEDGPELVRELTEDAAIPASVHPEQEMKQLLEGVCETGKASFTLHDGNTYGCLPLRAHGDVFGIVRLTIPPTVALTARRRRSLESIAEQSGPAVSNARLRLRVREVAVTEERGRIAREMHDGLAQMLAYVNTKAAAARHSLSQGRVETAMATLADLEAAAQDASIDVREDMLALRNADADASNLCLMVRDYVAKYERLSGVTVECRESGAPRDVRLPEMTELQVVRIIQEALSNVRKHAGVDRAVVTISVADGRLTARVDDDGRGFEQDPSSVSDRPRFGLQTMRERAESVSGELSLSSSPGGGTHVSVSVPLQASMVSSA